MQFVERLQPQATRLLDREIRSGVDCLVVRGEQGSGKTAMLDRLARAPGRRVIRLNVMWGSLEDQTMLLHAAAAQVDDLLGAEGAPGGDAPPALGPGADPGTELVRQVERLLAAGDGDPRPVWILVDDVDALHEEFVRGLRYVIARTAHLPGGVVCTATWPVPALESYQRLELEPLTVDGVRAAVESKTGFPPPARVARLLHEWTGGHTTMLAGLIQATTTSALAGTRRLMPGPPAEPTRRHAERALAQVTPEIRNVLTIVALIGNLDEPTFTALTHEMGVDERRLRQAQLVRSVGARVCVADGIVARYLAYRDSCTREDACRRVLAAAETVLPEEDRLLLSAAVADRDTALVPALTAAAVDAAAHSRIGRAYELITLTMAHSTAETYPQLAAARSLVAFLSGHLQDAADLAADDLARLAPSRERLELARIALLSRALLGEEVGFSALIDELLVHVEHEPEATARLARTLTLTAIALGDLAGAKDVLDLVEPQLPAHERQTPAWQYLHLRLTPGVATPDLRRHLRRWLVDTTDSHELSFDLHAEIAAHEETAVAARHLRAQLGHQLSPLHRAVVLALSAHVESARGRAQDATRYLTELEDLQVLGHFMPTTRTVSHLRTAAVAARVALPARVEAAATMASGAAQVLRRAHVDLARAAWLLAAGRDTQEAERLLNQVNRAVSRGDVPRGTTLGQVDLELVGPVLQVALCVRAGRLHEARRYVRSALHPRAGESPHAERARRLAQALLEDGATVPDLTGVPAWAVPAVERTLAPQGARALAGASVLESQDWPVPPRALDLTTRETDVAARILKGMRNRDIAAELYLSVRSVEATVTQLFRKTGTSSRAGLAAALSHLDRSTTTGGRQGS